jgi:hypothetical protein
MLPPLGIRWLIGDGGGGDWEMWAGAAKLSSSLSLCVLLTGVIFFDDSYEHEVANACESERVVFQLVFLHPDLWGTLADNPTQDMRQLAGFERARS